MKTKDGKQPRNIDLRREVLIALSVKARAYRDKQMKTADSAEAAMMWAGMRINDIVAMWYREQSGATIFKTFKQWHEEGLFVKKGEKAFVLWGRKRKSVEKHEQKPEGVEGDPQGHEYEFFPIVYLFSDLQVQPSRAHEPAESE